jgi:hypothetical protein
VEYRALEQVSPPVNPQIGARRFVFAKWQRHDSKVPADRQAQTLHLSVSRQASKDLSIKLRVRLPGLASDYAAITNGLLVYKCTSRLLGFEADMFIAGDALALCEAGGGQYLDAMTDSENPFFLQVKFSDNIEQAQIIAEVLRSSAAQNEDGIVLVHIYLVEREVSLKTVAGTLYVGIPPWLKVVHYEMEATNRRSSNGGAPVFLAKPMNRVKRFVGFAGISSNNQYL